MRGVLVYLNIVDRDFFGIWILGFNCDDIGEILNRPVIERGW